MTPFLFIGFDVIPQAAEEISVPYKKIGKIMLLSIFLAVAWYLLIIFAVCYIMPQSAIAQEMNSQNGLVSAKAIEIAFRSPLMGKVLIIGGLCGIITSWNSFLMGGSRALYSMGESLMIPKMFGKLGKTKRRKQPLSSAELPVWQRRFLEEAFWYGWLMLHLLAVLLPICSYLFPSVFSEKRNRRWKGLIR